MDLVTTDKLILLTKDSKMSNEKASKKVSTSVKRTVTVNRRKHRITKNFGRKQDTAKRTFMKTVQVVITGTDVDAIKQTARAIYAIQNDHTAGGKQKRTVQVTRMDSSDVETVFYGRH